MDSKDVVASERATEFAPQRILVVKIQGMGDLVLATPAIRAIRERFPNAHLTVAAKSGLIDILANEPYINELLPLSLPRRPLAWRDWVRLWRTLMSVRRRRFDLLVNLTTPLSYTTWAKCWLLNRLCRPSNCVEAHLADCLVPWARGTMVKFRHLCHEAEMNFRLMAKFVRVPDALVPALSTGLSPSGLGDRIPGADPPIPIIGVGIGGKQTHRWPLDQLIACVRILRLETVTRIVILGDSTDRDRAASLVVAAGPGIINLCGRIATSELPAAISSMDMLLTNDSGLMHVAAAVGTPLVALFGAGSPPRYRPLALRNLATMLHVPTDCSPCLLSYCPTRHCITQLSPETVADAVIARLRLQMNRTVYRPGEPK